MDIEKKPIDKLADSIHELTKDVGTLRNEISYIKVNLIMHIKSLEAEKKVKDIPTETEVSKGWFFS